MRHRGLILILAGTAMVTLLAALSMQQALHVARKENAAMRNAQAALEQKTAEALREAEAHKAAARAVEIAAAKFATDLSKQLAEHQGQLAAHVTAQVSTLATAQTTTSAQAQSKLAEIAALAGELKASLGELRSQSATQIASITGMLDELAKTRDQGAQIALHAAALEALKAAQDRQAQEARALEASIKRLEGDLHAERQKPSPAPRTSPGLEPRPPPPVPVSTSIEAVEPSDGVVVLGAGQASGLEAGHELHISRDGRRIGRVRVIKVYEGLAGAEILEQTPGESMLKGDRASTEAVVEKSPTPPVPLGRSDPPPPPPPPPPPAPRAEAGASK